jgi:2-keto-3-deoxy-L-rhamnonate aldolase RhmA
LKVGNDLLGSTRFSQETPDFLTLLMSHTPNDVDSIIKELEAANVLGANPAL